jgi:hypothetical protein
MRALYELVFCYVTRQKRTQKVSLYMINDRLSSFLTPSQHKITIVQRSHNNVASVGISGARKMHVYNQQPCLMIQQGHDIQTKRKDTSVSLINRVFLVINPQGLVKYFFAVYKRAARASTLLQELDLKGTIAVLTRLGAAVLRWCQWWGCGVSTW